MKTQSLFSGFSHAIYKIFINSCFVSNNADKYFAGGNIRWYQYRYYINFTCPRFFNVLDPDPGIGIRSNYLALLVPDPDPYYFIKDFRKFSKKTSVLIKKS
jgi:hypothetical protein